MRHLLCNIGLLWLLSSAVAIGQESELPAPANHQQTPLVRDTSPHASSFRSETARELVHRKAALKAAQRRQRLAANKAIGYSLLRPATTAGPAMGSPPPLPLAVRYSGIPRMFYPRVHGWIFPMP